MQAEIDKAATWKPRDSIKIAEAIRTEMNPESLEIVLRSVLEKTNLLSKGIVVKKISTSADLCEYSFTNLVKEYTDALGEKPEILFIHKLESENAKVVVNRIVNGIRVIVLPFLDCDAWAIAGSKGIFWSPGA